MSEKHIAVYKAIAAVSAALAKEGIAKDKTCTQGASYKFRGIDDVFNALAPLLSAHGLCILPRMISRECVERTSKSGGALFYTTVEAEFDFVSAEDGSMHTVKTFGEAMDSGDKSCNKAMSAAYKYAAFQSFCIPTEGDNDTENQTHEVKPKQAASRPAQAPTAATAGQTPAPMAKANLSLYQELGAYCEGDTEKMNTMLKRITHYEAEGKSYEFGLDRLPKASEKWAGKALTALRKIVASDVKDDIPEFPAPVICATCNQAVINGACGCDDPGPF